jgi:hypothetical protein
MKLHHLLMGLPIAAVLAISQAPTRAAEKTSASVDEEISAIRSQISKLQKQMEDLEKKRGKTEATAKREVDPSICADLDTAQSKSVKENKPLLLWVGQPARAVPGCISVHLDKYKRAHSPGVVIGLPDDDGDVMRSGDLSGNPSNEEIKKAIKEARTPAPTAAPNYSYAPQSYSGGFGNFGGGFGGGSGGGC